MTPRPIYRWKSFWLGILMLGFLAWAWIGPVRSYTTAFWITDTAEYGVEWGASQVGFAIKKPAVALGFDHWSIVRMELDDSAEVPVFAPSLYEETDGFRVVIGNWVLVAAFLLPWGAWLVWHWKREQRKANP